MPHFVTDIRPAHRAAAKQPARSVALDAPTRAALAYRRRMAALRERAPDTLVARVRRELRAAAQRSARTE
jgi:hypothetical protein